LFAHFSCWFYIETFFSVFKSVLQLEFQNVVSFARSSLRNVHHA